MDFYTSLDLPVVSNAGEYWNRTMAGHIDKRLRMSNAMLDNDFYFKTGKGDPKDSTDKYVYNYFQAK